MKKLRNTAHQGSVRYIVFKEKDTWYAVGLEFNIVESGDDPQMTMFGLFEAITGYVEAFKKIKGARSFFVGSRKNHEEGRIVSHGFSGQKNHGKKRGQ